MYGQLGIDALSGDYILVDKQQASAIQASPRHIIKQPIIHIRSNVTNLVSKTIHYSCVVDCIVNLNDFHFTDMNIHFDRYEAFASLTCILFTNGGYKVPFTLDNSIATPGAFLHKYPINIIILNKFYRDEQLYSLDGSSTFKHPPILDIPEIAIQYIDHDAPIKLNLDNILNDSLDNQMSYAHDWRRPDFLSTEDSTN